MKGKVSPSPNPSVVFVKSSKTTSNATKDADTDNTEDYVKSVLNTPSPDKNKKSSSKTITICTMCGRYKGYRMNRKLFIILCIAIILLAIFIGIIIVFYAIVPAIVRSTIEKSELSFRSVNIEDIENDRFRLRAQLELSRTGSIPATIRPPLIINVDNVGTVRNDQPIVIDGDPDRSTVVPVDSPFIISDLQAFHKFSRSLIFEEHVIWYLTSKVSVQPISGAMPVYSNIPFNKQVKLNALNSLQNVSIRSVSLLRSDKTRIVADIIIEIPNPSIFSIELGHLLAPLNEDHLPMVGKFFSAYLNNLTQSVILFHELSTNEDITTALDLTVSGLSMESNLDGIETKLIQRVEVLSFGIEFDSINVNKVYITGQLLVLFELPSNVHMTFKAFTTSINFVMRSDNGPNLGQMTLHDIPVEHNQVTNELLMKFNKQELVILNERAFQEFAANLVLTTNVSVTIEGLAEALAEIIIGNISLSNISVSDTLHLAGYDQFGNGLLNIDEVDLTKALSSHELSLNVKTRINNPSAVYILNGGRLSLDLRDFTSNISLGLVIIEPFYLEIQDNSTILNAEGTFGITPQNFAIAEQFVSRMVSGEDNEVELRGILPNDSIGTSIPLLSMAISDLRIRTHVPGLYGEKALVRQILLEKILLADIASIVLSKKLRSRIRLKNPFHAPLTITGMNVRVHFSSVIDPSKEIGTVTYNSNIFIGSVEEIITPEIEVRTTAGLFTLSSVLGSLKNETLRLSLSGSISVTIDNQLNLSQLPIRLPNILAKEEASM
ncbi:unnamed protein product [Rotaria sordida]|uniref:Uncharacterized protein n=1 Tax=Rotaria sordida TaxID=392033 RepID=A0A819X9G9_9BILA|nr:unnamed protein product [Rotaria sordida]